jgi:hypothetical protein
MFSDYRNNILYGGQNSRPPLFLLSMFIWFGVRSGIYLIWRDGGNIRERGSNQTFPILSYVLSTNKTTPVKCEKCARILGSIAPTVYNVIIST